jgi:hypothetical protein
MTKIAPNYKMLADLLTERVSWQPNTLIICLPIVTSAGQFTDFIGENPVEYDCFSLKCFFSVTNNSKDREKFGVDSNVDIIFYISPEDLEKEIGVKEFSVRTKKTTNVKLTFKNQDFKANNITNVEIVEQAEDTKHIAIKIEAKKV